MNLKTLSILISLTGITFFAYAQEKESVIAFGSCDNEDKPQELWPEVVKQKPMLWIWGGDNVYADTGDTIKLKARYCKQKSDPGYQQLLKTCPITGTYDDHDYGMNDGGKYWPHKDEAKKMSLLFLGIPKSNPVWSHSGIYNSTEVGDGKEKIKIINLDTRYFRDTLVKVFYQAPGTERKDYRYEVNSTGDILGELQWQWLEAELKNTDASLIILNSSIQVLSEEHRFEKWGNFPTARKRLLDLLAKLKKNVIIISGDRHIAEFSKINLLGWNVPLYDFTSSGITHTWPEQWKEDNRYRVGDLIIQKTFGIIRVKWKPQQFEVTMQIRGKEDRVYQQEKIVFSR